VPLDGSGAIDLLNRGKPVHGDAPDWSLDGSQIVFGSGSGLSVMNTDGSQLHGIVGDVGDCCPEPDW
jgi:Tol biopolymer transport system component